MSIARTNSHGSLAGPDRVSRAGTPRTSSEGSTGSASSAGSSGSVGGGGGSNGHVSARVQIALFIAGWYICSGGTLFGNKHMLSTLHANPHLLAISQMTITATMGASKIFGPYLLAGCDREMIPPTPYTTLPTREFVQDMVVVGVMRVVTVLLGLVSLKFIAVSFTETVKSSAPFFTVIVARLMLGEKTSMMVNLSLVPVVLGLALTSATELSFTPVGFGAAVLTNCIDCVQNVFSKKLLSTKGYNYVNLQFFTSAAALVVQMPLMLYLHWGTDFFGNFTTELAIALAINGVFFHLQSVMAYAVMGLVSPVTQSVVNTLKRALLIWLSVLVFRNAVTPLSAIGTAVCVAGVLAYNYASRLYPTDKKRDAVRDQQPRDIQSADAVEMRPLHADSVGSVV